MSPRTAWWASRGGSAGDAAASAASGAGVADRSASWWVRAMNWRRPSRLPLVGHRAARPGFPAPGAAGRSTAREAVIAAFPARGGQRLGRGWRICNLQLVHGASVVGEPESRVGARRVSSESHQRYLVRRPTPAGLFPHRPAVGLWGKQPSAGSPRPGSAATAAQSYRTGRVPRGRCRRVLEERAGHGQSFTEHR